MQQNKKKQINFYRIKFINQPKKIRMKKINSIKQIKHIFSSYTITTTFINGKIFHTQKNRFEFDFEESCLFFDNSEWEFFFHNRYMRVKTTRFYQINLILMDFFWFFSKVCIQNKINLYICGWIQFKVKMKLCLRENWGKKYNWNKFYIRFAFF